MRQAEGKGVPTAADRKSRKLRKQVSVKKIKNEKVEIQRITKQNEEDTENRATSASFTT